jgi:hypothetical protein
MALDREYAREEMRGRESEELLEILAERNEEEWSPDVFTIVEEVLRERNVSVSEEVARVRAELVPAPDAAAPLTGVAEFEVKQEAVLCRLELAQAGVEALVRGVEDPEHGQIFEVIVSERDLERANEVLDAALVDADAGEDGEGFRCPSCGFTAEPLRENGRLVCQVCGKEAF